MPDPMMVRLAVSSPDSPPLTGSTQVIAQPNNSTASSAAINSYVHQTDTAVAPTTTPPAQTSVSPTQQNSHQMASNIPPGAIPLNQMSPHHMPPYHHHPQNGVLHDHSNGHHHNGLYLGPAYTNEFYPAGADAPPHGAYFIPPELCPAHTQLCTVHPEYGEKIVIITSKKILSSALSLFSNFSTLVKIQTVLIKAQLLLSLKIFPHSSKLKLNDFIICAKLQTQNDL